MSGPSERQGCGYCDGPGPDCCLTIRGERFPEAKPVSGPSERETCAKSQRVDGPWHSDQWYSDGSYVECVYCGRIADAITGSTIREARS